MPALVDDSQKANGRLLLVSNRLPITIKRSEDGQYSFSQSSGGLVTGLSGLAKSTTFQWYGWPGLEVPEAEAGPLVKRLRDEYSAVPVFVDDELADKHYNGFSNSILWPLFHYHPGEITFDESHWAAYKEVNRLFARTMAKDVQDGDLVWVHDYHLMLLPEMLREEIGSTKKNVKIGFFLHTPFPSSEIYRILPVREDLLLSVLHCDLIGFHTYDYARHFLSSCSRILLVFRYSLMIQAWLTYGRETQTTPNGVEFREHPEWIGKVVLVQVAVPSRQDVEEYQNLRAVVNELVGRINGRFGTIEFMPIHFLHQSVSFEELTALYAVSDACLVSSTRDGMNLVSYEYIATQRKRHGVMILSEFTGAAQSLNGALVVNPWNTEELADAIHDAVTMSPEQREINFKKLEKYVFKYTSAWWGESFVAELMRISELADKKMQRSKGGEVQELEDGVKQFNMSGQNREEGRLEPGEFND
ncbi:Alpha,alpha-trehalose-phosphate synthase protein [Rutstroemia sp. NJR-2017a WRK4]|nr:Alpha,alpha-trehalose-phosphate synthase protein [Rutstroemia sp. NJR-2017a WRK4]